MQKAILTSLDCPKSQSVLYSNSKISWKVAVPKESPLKTLLTVSLPDHMLYCKFHSKTVKKASEKYISLIWPVIKEVPITWTWKNKLKSMDNKSTSLSSNSNNVFEALIRAKTTYLSEVPNLPCVSKILLSVFVEPSWLETFPLHQPAVKTL